jgi:hypothetical protein
MRPSIRIVRYPYEEPYTLNLVITASNGNVGGRLEFYLGASELLKWAEELERFPMHARSVYLWEVGSEYPEDRFGFYFRLRLFTTDSLGHCAIQFRFNNNAALPDREISEFCIGGLEPAQINRLGQLCRKFAALKHEVLDWSPTDGRLCESAREVE